MSRPPLFRPAAAADLDEIWDYTADRWGIDQAERYIGAIRDICAALARGEATGRDASDIRPGYRRALCGRHLIFYRLRDDGRVEVVRILHQRTDVRSRLDEF